MIKFVVLSKSNIVLWRIAPNLRLKAAEVRNCRSLLPVSTARPRRSLLNQASQVNWNDEKSSWLTLQQGDISMGFSQAGRAEIGTLARFRQIFRRTLPAILTGSYLFMGASLFPSTASARDALVRFAASAPYVGTSVSLVAEIYRPSGSGRFPAVVLMHGCGGWQAAVRYGLQQHAIFLRDNGFVVLNLDSFGPRGLTGGTVCESLERMSDARSYRAHDAFDALRYLHGLDYVDPNKVFLMGQSDGGSVALMAAATGASDTYNPHEGSFRAVVAYYPWCDVLGTTRLSLDSPLLVFGGARDDWTPPDDCRRFQSRGAEVRVTIYPEAAHSFDLLAPIHRYLGKLVGYDQRATDDSRQEMLAFFRGHMDGDVSPRVAFRGAR